MKTGSMLFVYVMVVEPFLLLVIKWKVHAAEPAKAWALEEPWALAAENL